MLLEKTPTTANLPLQGVFSCSHENFCLPQISFQPFQGWSLLTFQIRGLRPRPMKFDPFRIMTFRLLF